MDAFPGMEVSDDLLTLFSGEVEKHGDSYVIEVPERELDIGELREGETYRVAILSTTTNPAKNREVLPPQSSRSEGPPVEEGDVLDVEIEDMGDQGDGLTRVGPGYVVIVPDTTVGDRVTVEISEARENVAFADVVGSTHSVQ